MGEALRWRGIDASRYSRRADGGLVVSVGFRAPGTAKESYSDRNRRSWFNARAEIDEAEGRIEQLVHESALFVKRLAQTLFTVEALILARFQQVDRRVDSYAEDCRRYRCDIAVDAHGRRRSGAQQCRHDGSRWIRGGVGPRSLEVLHRSEVFDSYPGSSRARARLRLTSPEAASRPWRAAPWTASRSAFAES